MIACRIADLLGTAMVTALMIASPLARADISLGGGMLGWVRSHATI